MADGNTIASHVIWNAMASTPYREDNSLKRHSPNVRANDRSAGTLIPLVKVNAFSGEAIGPTMTNAERVR